MGQEGL